MVSEGQRGSARAREERPQGDVEQRSAHPPKPPASTAVSNPVSNPARGERRGESGQGARRRRRSINTRAATPKGVSDEGEAEQPPGASPAGPSPPASGSPPPPSPELAPSGSADCTLLSPGDPMSVLRAAAPPVQMQSGSPSSCPLLWPSPSESALHRLWSHQMKAAAKASTDPELSASPPLEVINALPKEFQGDPPPARVWQV